MIRVEWHGHVAVVVIDRDEVLNALDATARSELAATIWRTGQDPRLRCLVLTGGGKRAFCVGQDLHEAGQLDERSGQRWMASWNGLYDAIAALPVPSLALIGGVAVGAGLQLGLLCDVRIASTDARLGLREVEIGLPAITGLWLLDAMVGRSVAAELILTGRLMGAAEARRLGLVRDVVASEDLRSSGLELAVSMANRPMDAMRRTREYLATLLGPGMHEAKAAAARDQVAAIRTDVPQSLMAAFLAERRSRRPSATNHGGNDV